MFAKRVTVIGNNRLWGGNTWSELHLPEQDVGIVGDFCATRLLQVYIASASCHGHQSVFPFGVRCLVPRSSALLWTCGQRPVRHVQSRENKIIYYVCVSICYIHQCAIILLTAYVPFDMNKKTVFNNSVAAYKKPNVAPTSRISLTGHWVH